MTGFQQGFLTLCFTCIICTVLQVYPTTTLAFAPHPVVGQARHGRTANVAFGTLGESRRRIAVFSSPDEKSTAESETPAAVSAPPPPPPPAAVEESPSYPIDLPSPLLLATSMVLAIVGTGSAFDLANDSPRYGFGVTFSIATIGLTLSVGLFYASVLKAKAETEADDKEYMKGK